MKSSIPFLVVFLLLISCGSNKEIMAYQKFEKNAKTVMDYLEGFQNQKIDYSSYSKDFTSLTTTFGDSKATITLDELKETNNMMFEVLQFKLLEKPVFFTGVDPKTGVIDGSIKFYGNWEITLKKTNTTNGKTARLKVYESIDFDRDGKILFEQGYGDFSGLSRFFND